MVNEAGTSLDEIILQIYEEKEPQFYWPVTSQKEARAFVKALNGKGVKYEDVSAEIDEFSSNFTAWRKGLGRVGIGNRVIERINRPLQEVLQSDDEDDDVVDKVRKFKASRANGDRPKSPSPELENRLHSKGEVSKEQKKDIQESWQKNIEKKTDVLKKGDSNGNMEASSSGGSSTSSSSASRSTSGTNSSSSSVEREVKDERLSEERTALRKVDRNSKVEPVAEDIVFARSETSKEEDVVVAQANVKPSDILKRQSPQRSVSPINQRSPTPKREQSPLVERSNIPQKATQAEKVNEEPLPEPQKAHKEEEEPLPVSAKEKKVMDEEPLPGQDEAVEVSKDADEEEEDLFRDSPKLSQAPKADSESLSSSSSSSSSDEESEEEEEEEEKDAKKKEESSEESSSSEEESEDKEKSDEEKIDEEKTNKEEKQETIPAVKVTPAAESEDEEDEDDNELITENYDSDFDKDTGNTSADFAATRKYISTVKMNDDDGPGYIYVFTDSARDATHNRMKVDASRYPEKRLEQTNKFNLDMRLNCSIAVTERKFARIRVHNALEKYRMDHQRNWFYGLPDKIVNIVKKECEKFVPETSDC